MNVWQRIVIMLGTLSIILVVFLTPKVQYDANKGVKFKADNYDILQNSFDVSTIATYGVLIILITLALFLVLKRKSDN